MGEVALGIVANPMSGRDIRRLVAKASVFPTAEKANMIQRILTAAAVVGLPKVLMSTDVGGISAAVLRALQAHAGTPPWPEVEFVELPAHSQTATDSVALIREMIARGATALICLGGDGTARVAAGACGDVPLLPLSTGTNNAFPTMREATVAGLAAALIATGAVSADDGTRRATTLRVSAPRPGSGELRTENALVDVAIARTSDVGARALWDPDVLTELYVTFAEPDGIGLSSIPGLLCPSPRTSPDGVALRLCPPSRARVVVQAPIAPGLVLPVGVSSWRPMAVGEQLAIETDRGVIAVDGERELAFAPGRAPPSVELSAHGPRIVDIAAVMAAAAREGLLRTPPPTPQERS
ncbi:MAG: NAD(+)/NADH kinase [Kineosporiaceae bacterium]|nr:NAD(+)/NADH kinase [Kineosporiaceae bacterium]